MSTASSLRLALWLSVGLAGCTPSTPDEESSDSGTPGFGAGGCEDPTPLLQSTDKGDVPTGYVLCASGVVHREIAAAADWPSDATGTCTWDTATSTMCGSAACDNASGEYCNQHPTDWYEDCRCNTTCRTDSDCDAGEACYPDGVATTCIPAQCATDADCDAGLLCQVQAVRDSCGNTFYEQACQTADDECRLHEDCADSEAGSDCRFDGDKYACQHNQAYYTDCGRPFTVAGHGRVAPTRPRADWLSVPDTLPPHPDAAARWVEYGQLEHASIASFSRFAMELLSLGAPPALVREAHEAGMDEIEHAQLCFGMAAAFGAGPVGPGPLDVRDALSDGMDVASIGRRLVQEACIGETLAALEAAEASRHTSDPAVRSVLETIAADEQRHAELGWRCLRWLLRTHGTPDLRAQLAAVFEHALASPDDAPTLGLAGLEDYGLLSPPARHALLDEGRRAVIAPLAAALLDSEHGAEAVA